MSSEIMSWTSEQLGELWAWEEELMSCALRWEPEAKNPSFLLDVEKVYRIG